MVQSNIRVVVAMKSSDKPKVRESEPQALGKPTIDQSFLKRYYEWEAEQGSRVRAMYEGNDRWDRHWHEKIRTSILALLKRYGSEGAFLDAGCGEGLYLQNYRANHRGSKCIGLDISRNYLKNARLSVDSVDFVEGDVCSLPFRDASFDVVLCTETLEHVLNPRQAFVELLRCSQRVVIVSVPGRTIFFHLARLFGLAKRRSIEEIFATPGGGHLHELRVREMERWIPRDQRWHKSEEVVTAYFSPILARRLRLPIQVIDLFDWIIARVPLLNTYGVVQCLVLNHGDVAEP